MVGLSPADLVDAYQREVESVEECHQRLEEEIHEWLLEIDQRQGWIRTLALREAAAKGQPLREAAKLERFCGLILAALRTLEGVCEPLDEAEAG